MNRKFIISLVIAAILVGSMFAMVLSGPRAPIMGRSGDDNNPPHIRIIKPEHGDVVSGTIEILMCAWDDDGNDDIEEVWVRIDEGHLRDAVFMRVDDECSWWFYEWDTTEVEDGWHSVTAIAFDGEDDAHHTIEVEVDNEPDNHPPHIQIIKPEHGDTVSGTIEILMCAWDEDGNDDIEQVWVRIDEGDLREATFLHSNDECSWWNYEWDTTEVDDGWHSIRAVVWDGEDDGHHVIEVYVDNHPENHPPQIEITEPDGGATVSGTIVIWMCAWDPDGNDQIQDVWVRIDHGDWRNATHNHTCHECSWWYYEWDTTEVDDGWHLITAIVYDGMAYGDDHIEVYVDNHPENHPPMIEIVEPDGGATISGTVVIWMCAWDPDGNDQIQDVWVRIDHGDWRNATHNHTDAECSWWYYEWDTTEVDDGWHHITAIVYDGIDYGDDHIEVYVDNIPENHPPQIEIVEPGDGETVHGIVVIWMCAWDPDGNEQIQDVWVRIDHGDWLNATHDHTDVDCSWWFFEWDTTEVDDGWHLISAIVYDGIDYGDDHIEVYVDNP